MSFFPTTDTEKLRQALTQGNMYYSVTSPPSPARTDEDMDRDQAAKDAWPATGTSQQDPFPVSQPMTWTPESTQALGPEALSTPTQSMFEANYTTSDSYNSSSAWAPTPTPSLPSTTYPEYMQTTTLSHCYPITTSSWDSVPSTATTFASDYDTSPSHSEYSSGSRPSIFESSPYAESEGFLPAAGSPYIKVEDEFQRPRLYSVPGALPSDQPLHVNPGDIYSSPALSAAEAQALESYTFPQKVEQEDFKPFLRAERPQRPTTRRALSEEGRMLENRQKRGYTTHANSTCHCEQCGKLFQRSYNLKAHMETHDPHRDQPHVCQHHGCKRRFVRRTDLLRHEQSVHLKERKFGCPLCLSAFARKDTLRRHIDDGCPRRPEVKKRLEKMRNGSDASESRRASRHYWA